MTTPSSRWVFVMWNYYYYYYYYHHVAVKLTKRFATATGVMEQFVTAIAEHRGVAQWAVVSFSII